MYSLTTELNEASALIANQYDLRPEIALTLGSGLGFFAEDINQSAIIPYSEIPHFPQSTVEGHAGQLVFGDWGGTSLVIAQGRQHHYEGYSLDEVTFATRLFHQLGAKSLIITNAAGCANPEYAPGEFMTITDHFSMAASMLPASYDALAPGDVWDTQSAEQLREHADNEGIFMRDGTYAWVTGPSYETKAEVQYIRNRGGDAIGMSTVPEAIAAAGLGMNILGISCFTNYATGLSATALSHEEVSATAASVKHNFASLVKSAIRLY